MPSRAIPYVKAFVHLLCLAPLAYLFHLYRSGQMAADADLVNYLTHFTGNWALWILLVSLGVTPVRRVHARLANLIRFRRLLGLYAFFYASLHFATYVFLFSGYDVVTALAGLRQGHPGELWTQWRVIWPAVWNDLKKRRFIQAGLFAWIILFALALTSPLFMLRRMGGRNWQRLHNLVYLAAIAASIHFWWLVKAGVRAPLPDTLVLAGLLFARIAWKLGQRRRTRTSRPVVAAASGSPTPHSVEP